MLAYEEYRKTAIEMIMAGVKAADPAEAVKRHVAVVGDTLKICDLELGGARRSEGTRMTALAARAVRG